MADSVCLEGWQPDPTQTAHELPPNAWRILAALGLREPVEQIAYFPLADLTRSAATSYVLAQRPLREFARDRYGYAHACVDDAALVALLKDRVALLVPGDSPTLALTNRRESQDTRPELTRETFVLDRDDNDRAQRFLNRWLAARSAATCLPTRKHRVVELVRSEPERWHDKVTEGAQPVHAEPRGANAPVEHWFRGSQASFGRAAHGSLNFSGMGVAVALVDAWVLSRMLDNYDDHLPTALTEYERFRRARARRLHRYEQHALVTNLQQSATGVRSRNLKLAFGSRFLPEMAMQRLDWLYGFDAVKGFN